MLGVWGCVCWGGGEGRGEREGVRLAGFVSGSSDRNNGCGLTGQRA